MIMKHSRIKPATDRSSTSLMPSHINTRSSAVAERSCNCVCRSNLEM